MIRVTLEPMTGGSGPRIFNTVGFDYTVSTAQLVLYLRDGKMCIEMAGNWLMQTRGTHLVAHSVEEAMRIHDGSSLIVMA